MKKKYRFQLFKFFLHHMFIPISAVLFFIETVFGGLGLGLEGAGLGLGPGICTAGLGLEGAGLGLGLDLETTGLGLGTLVLTTRLNICNG